MGIRCAVSSCYSSEREKQRAFFRFPKNLTLCRQWIEAAGRPDLESKDIETIHKSYRICDMHFDPDQRFNNRLKANAVPTCYLPETSEEVDNRTKSTQTEIEINPCGSLPSTSAAESYNVTAQSIQCKNTSRKRKWSNTSLNPCETESITIKQEIFIPYQNRESKLIVAHKRIEFINNLLKQVYPGKLFDDEYKKFVEKLYFSSPLAYRFLYKALNLPSEKMVRMKNIDVIYLSDSMIRCLQYKCKQFCESEKVCVLSLSTMELKCEHIGQIPTNRTIECGEINGSQTKDRAKYVVVLMARGLFSNWTQPIAFRFSKPTINYPEITAWVYGIITKIVEIGFDAVAITTDNESIFYNMSKNYPCFTVNDRKTYLIFDVPQLINSLRNVFLINNFVFQDGGSNELIASWDDIRSIFNLERNSKCRIAYNLTGNHIKPRIFERSAVKFAAQVFSRSVAVAIKSNIGPGKLSSKAIGTATFVQRMNDIFDILNSSPNNSSATCKYKKRFSGESYQRDALHEFINFLCPIRVISKSNKDETMKVRCLNDFRITINSILYLSDDLKTKGFNYFYTRRLNTDVLKDFFKTVSQKRGVCREPTPSEFYGEFKKHFLNAAINTQSMNSASELNKLFLEIKDMYIKSIHVYKEFQKITEFLEITSKESEESEEEEEEEEQDEWLEIKSNLSDESQEDNKSLEIKPNLSEESNEKYSELLEIKPNKCEKTEEEDNEFFGIMRNEIQKDTKGHNALIEIQSNQGEKSNKDCLTNNLEEKEVKFMEINSNENVDQDQEIQSINDEIKNILTRNPSVEEVRNCHFYPVFKIED